MRLRTIVFALAACLIPSLCAQDTPYSRKNTLAPFAEYSNDSSHIFLGITPNRKLAGIGAQYERRLTENRIVRWSYLAEFRPFILSSDPVANLSTTYRVGGGAPTGPFTQSDVVFQCRSGTYSTTETSSTGPPVTFTTVTTCSRNLTLAQGGSPIGFRVSFFPRRRLQLMFSANGGYMYSTQQIPIPTAGSFNFTFNFGGGFEYFLRPHRSMRLEYLVQHYSNHGTAVDNPGVDSGFARLSYAFGR